MMNSVENRIKEYFGMNPKKAVYYGLPFLGLLFCLWYINSATVDIVYSDYIRIVLNYLPDVGSLDKFLCPDVLTRIPLYYLVRLINVVFFQYNTTFEMVLGAVGLWLSAMVLARYSEKKQISLVWFLLLMFILFGLNKWEMLVNGTGCIHFLAFACFYLNFLMFDAVVYEDVPGWKKYMLVILPVITTLAIAGPYCAVYTVVMVLAYLFVLAAGPYLRKKLGETDACRKITDRKLAMAGILSVVIPFLLYLWSNAYAITEYDGVMEGSSLLEVFFTQPMFFARFLVKAMASMVIGAETMEELVSAGTISGFLANLLGVLLGCGYLLALLLNLRFRLYEKTLVPLMLIFSGMGNHAIVLISRYIFGRVDYGMSSRYALQYQAGLLGIILTFALVWKLLGQEKLIPRVGVRCLAAAFCIMILAGHSYTDYRELQKAPYRKMYGENIVQAALQFEDLSDDELRATFDYRKGREDSGRDVRRALTTLKDHKWNVFRD
jgi:hypothetical protein